MPGRPAFPTLNGFATSWADIAIPLLIHGGQAIKTADIAAVKWSAAVEVGTQYGASGGMPTKRTSGMVKYDGCSLTFYRSGWELFMAALAAKSTDGRLSLVCFDVVVQHTPPNDSAIHKVELLGARALGMSGDHSDGSVDPETVEVPLSVMRVQLNGRRLI